MKTLVTLFKILGILTIIPIPFIIMWQIADNEKKKQIKAIEDESKKIIEKFKPIVDIQQEITNKKLDLNQVVEQLNNAYNQVKQAEVYKNDLINDSNKLKEILQFHESDIELYEFGFYQPLYNFGTSALYKSKLDEIKNKQKQILQEHRAINMAISWTMNGSAAEGKKVLNDLSRLMLLAFNGYCDSLLSKIKFDNVVKFIDNLQKEKDLINKLGRRFSCEITDIYADLKIEELRLVYEYQCKLNEEREEQRRIKEEMREEEKVRREFEKALKEAQDEEKRYEKALEQAKLEYEQANDEEKIKLELKLNELQLQLEQIQDKERKISQAQITKMGHVYVISNIGSFGENIYKIGMTRRQDPMERVWELCSASVPFDFDVHAIIFSDNAPDLEAQLHRHFDHKRLNMVNRKKEYFSVTLDEIEKIVHDNHGQIEFTKMAEAKEYRETLLLRN